jgi:hypothetical protein
MNIQGLSYWEQGYFNDVMTATSSWITYHSGSGWNTNVADQLQLDTNGYPTHLPQLINSNQTMVRCMLNNCYVGRFRFMYDGDGDISWNVSHELVDGKHYITLDGACDHKWIQITRSNQANPLRNIRILPDSLADIYDPTNAEHLFQPLFLQGIRPFHAVRFMDWMHTNGSTHKTWAKRATPTYYSQSVRGACAEHAITLCNYLGADAWFCVPHAADDEYIRNFATLVRDRLDSRLKVYVEYSNEVWNWQFAQAQWACRNGIYGDAALYPADTLRDQLRQVGQQYCGNATDECVCHPEKDAHLMARVFKIWRSVFAAAGQEDRLVRTAAIQVGWCANTSRVLAHLATQGGCDAVSPTGYFNFTQADHDTWNANPSAVTPQMVTAAVSSHMDDPSYWDCIRTTADQASQYSLDVVMYEAGQHMQPWQQGEWAYNQAVWDAQIHSTMYDLYLKYYRISDSIYTNYANGIALCAAFSYTGERESRWGSWGHLENYQQLLDMPNMKTNAPKYQALLDMNTPRAVLDVSPRSFVSPSAAGGFRITALVQNQDSPSVTFVVSRECEVIMQLFDARGRVAATLARGRFAAGSHIVRPLRRSFRGAVSAGLYVLKSEIRNVNGSVSYQTPVTIR